MAKAITANIIPLEDGFVLDRLRSHGHFIDLCTFTKRFRELAHNRSLGAGLITSHFYLLRHYTSGERVAVLRIVRYDSRLFLEECVGWGETDISPNDEYFPQVEAALDHLDFLYDEIILRPYRFAVGTDHKMPNTFNTALLAETCLQIDSDLFDNLWPKVRQFTHGQLRKLILDILHGRLYPSLTFDQRVDLTTAVAPFVGYQSYQEI